MELSITIRYDNGIKRGITLARSEADEHNIESNFDFGYDVRQALNYLDVPCYDKASKSVPPIPKDVTPLPPPALPAAQMPTMYVRAEVDAMIAEALEADRAKRPHNVGDVTIPKGAKYGDFMDVDGFPAQSIAVPPMDHQFLRIAGYASKSIRYGLVGGATTDVPVFMPTVDFTGDLIDCPEDFVPVIVTVLR